MLELSKDVKRILITADAFSLKSGHKQLTAATVLTFILEEFKPKIDNFFTIKTKVLAMALRQEDTDGSGERYSNNLVMSLHMCGKIVNIENLTEYLLSNIILNTKH